MTSRILILAICATSTLFASQSGDTRGWRQFGGPGRDFTVESGPLATTWGDAGPEQLWRRELGEGYSSILVDDGLLVTMYRRGDSEIIVALDAQTGETVWEYAYQAPLAHNGYFDVWLNSAGPGPYSTPMIADGVVFAVGVNGQFHALERSSGELLWSLDLVDTFDVDDYNAFASSPLAYGSTVIVPLGGSSRGVVAFSQETGATVWRSPEFPLGPGSPILAAVDGDPHLVVLGQQELIGLSPDDGQIRWRHPHENELGLNISMPVWGADNLLFASSGYDTGSRMLRLTTRDGATVVEEAWSNNRLRLHFGNAIRVGDLVVGSSGDFGPAFLTALDVLTGEEVWRDRSFARANAVLADGKLVLVDEDGDIAVTSVSADGLHIHARGQVLTENAWTPPTLVDGTLYIRDRLEIVAIDLTE